MDPISNFKNLGLSERLAQNLVNNGFETFFDIQNLVIPKLLQNNSRRCIQPRHICASAPTGSGKTLAYVVPLLQALQRNHFAEIRLKAIVILPTRELAIQVYDVFTQLSKGLNVSIGIATGQVSIEQERENLVGDASSIDLGFGCSAVDILICTPGRLQDHLLLTPRFTLEHLRFIVLDEADRLLGNAYHHWVKALVQSSTGSTAHGLDTLLGAKKHTTSVAHDATHPKHAQNQTAIRESDPLGYLPPSFLHGSRQRSVQRLLFSATLSDNPAKLALLGVRNPLIFRVGGSTSALVDPDSAMDAAHSEKLSSGLGDEEEEDVGFVNDDDDDEEEEEEEEVDGMASENVDGEDSDESKQAADGVDSDNDADADGSDDGEEKGEDNGPSKEPGASGLLEVRRISQQVADANAKVATDALIASSQLAQAGVYHLPPGLTESICVCDTKHRPLALAALLYEACSLERGNSNSNAATSTTVPSSADQNAKSVKKSRMFLHNLRGYCHRAGDMVVVFASSVETVHRLSVLLQLLNGQVEDSQAPQGISPASRIGTHSSSSRVGDSSDDESDDGTSDDDDNEDGKESSQAKKNKKRKLSTAPSSTHTYLFSGEVREMSRSLRAYEREETMSACRAGQVKILVATDQMARGIDLPNIKIAVNYDCPSDVKTYLHRVGRTARGRSYGHALTMLKVGQAGVFHTLHKEIVPSEAQRVEYASQSESAVSPDGTTSNTGSYPVLRSRPDPQVENGPLAKTLARALKLLPLVLAEWDSGSIDDQRFFLR